MENNPTAYKKIFFSYSRVDGEQYAFKLADDLRAAGANIWIDQQNIELGKLWDLEVEKALNEADCVLFIATEKSVASNNVLNEVSYALDENKTVIPVVFHDCRIPFGLKRLQRIDFTREYNPAFDRLLNALRLKTAAGSAQGEKNESEKAAAVKEQKGEPVFPASRFSVEANTAKPPESLPTIADTGQKKKRRYAYFGIGGVAAAGLVFFLIRGLTGESKPKDAMVLSAEKQRGFDSSTRALPTNPVSKIETQGVNASGAQSQTVNDPKNNVDKSKTNEKSFESYLQAGKNEFGKGLFREAINDLNKALALRDDAEVFYFLGRSYGALNDFPGAVEQYGKAIGRDPKNSNYYGARAAAYHNSKDYTASVADWTQVIGLSPNNAEAYFRRGVNRRLSNDAGGACDDFAVAAKLGNEDGRKNYDQYCGQNKDAGTKTYPYKLNKNLLRKPANRVKDFDSKTKTNY